MNGRYTLVHFVPDPVAGTRIPVAVIAETRRGPEVVVRPQEPSVPCLGGEGRAHLLRAIMTEITTATSVDALPAGLGPNVVLTEPRDLPPNLDDIATWARSAFFVAEKAGRPREPRGRHRATKGYQYLTNLKVARFVGKNFEARPTGWLPTAARIHLPKVSHYVPGTRELLLMEPVDPSHEWEKQAQLVATRFAAYENAIRKDGVADRVRMLAYLLPGGPMRDRDEARERIAPVANVVDTARKPDVERFVEEIVQVAQPALIRVTP